jgi:hypothetical protein
MAEERWERLAAATGIIFVILGVAAYLIAGTPPKAGASAEEIVAYHVDNLDAIQTSSYLWGIAGIFFLWFLGSLRAHLRRAEGDTGRLSAVVFGSGLVAGTIYTVGVLLYASIHAHTSPEATHLLHDVAMRAVTFSAFGFIAFAVATALISGRTKVYPAWLGLLAWLVALAGAGASLALLVDSGPFATGEIFGKVAFGLFFLWFLALSVVTTQQVGKEPARS